LLLGPVRNPFIFHPEEEEEEEEEERSYQLYYRRTQGACG
jgi:hypothetical protein